MSLFSALVFLVQSLAFLGLSVAIVIVLFSYWLSRRDDDDDDAGGDVFFGLAQKQRGSAAGSAATVPASAAASGTASAASSSSSDCSLDARVVREALARASRLDASGQAPSVILRSTWQLPRVVASEIGSLRMERR